MMCAGNLKILLALTLLWYWDAAFIEASCCWMEVCTVQIRDGDITRENWRIEQRQRKCGTFSKPSTCLCRLNSRLLSSHYLVTIVSIWVSIGESVGAIFRSHVHDDGGEKAKRTHIKAEWVLHVGMVPHLCTRSEDRLYSTIGCRSGRCLPLWCVCVCLYVCECACVCVCVTVCMFECAPVERKNSE